MDWLRRHELTVPETLPLLDVVSVRDVGSVVSRLLAMHAIAACAFGFPRDRAVSWLRRERLDGDVTPRERDFLTTQAGGRAFQDSVEAIWALAWAVRLVDTIDVTTPCDDAFVQALPDLHRGDSADAIRRRAAPREPTAIVEACDLAYCLHWILRDASLRGRAAPRGLDAVTIVERRRALDWLVSEEAWDNLTLDT